MCHPLLVFDGEMGQLLTAVLRDGNAHASRGAVGVLKRIVGRLRRAWGEEPEIEIRADADFAVPVLYDYCEKEGIDYAVGLITNPRLVALAEPLLKQAHNRYEAEGHEVRFLSEGSCKAESWERAAASGGWSSTRRGRWSRAPTSASW
jgi:hypothetical protein